MTVDQLSLAYLRQAEQYYVKGGQQTGHVYAVRAALRCLVRDYGTELADDFSPRKFKRLRHRLIGKGLSRRYINDLMAVVTRAFRWAASEELVSPDVPNALQIVDGLHKGRSEARETPPVLPVSVADVEAILPHVSKQIAAMVRLQLMTGMRPGEVLALRPSEIAQHSDGSWEYRPQSHKTEHHARQRVIFIGPRGQQILRPWLDRDPNDYCFQPCESDRRHRNKRGPGKWYRVDSYRTAIQRACKKVDIPKWSPNQLRHYHATRVRARYGLEAVQAVLDHANANTSEIYAERDLRLAAKVQREIG